MCKDERHSAAIKLEEIEDLEKWAHENNYGSIVGLGPVCLKCDRVSRDKNGKIQRVACALALNFYSAQHGYTAEINACESFVKKDGN